MFYRTTIPQFYSRYYEPPQASNDHVAGSSAVETTMTVESSCQTSSYLLTHKNTPIAEHGGSQKASTATSSSRWRHLIFACQISESVASDFVRMYVNGILDVLKHTSTPSLHTIPQCCHQLERGWRTF